MAPLQTVRGLTPRTESQKIIHPCLSADRQARVKPVAFWCVGKQYNKSPKKIKEAFHKRLKLFRQDKFHPLLDNHPIIGKFMGYHSINITGDWRAIATVKQNGVF